MNLFKSMKLRASGYHIPSVEFMFINDAGSNPDKTVPVQACGISMNYAGTVKIEYERALGVNEHSTEEVKIGDTWLK